MARCEPESVQVERDIILLGFAQKQREQLSNSQSRHQPAEPEIYGTEQNSDPEYVHGKVTFSQKIAHINSFWHFMEI
jgi:hypothetical protein